MPINILYIIWSLGLGGAEQVVINLARGLDRSKFQPFVCCLNDKGTFASVLESSGIKVYEIRKKPGLDFSVVPKIVNIIRENNIDVVHTHLWGANFWGRFAARAAGVPVVATEHNVDVWKTPVHFMIDRYLFGKTSALIVVSDEVGRFYSKKLRVPVEKIRVVYNGVDIERIEGGSGKGEERKRLKEQMGIEEGERVVSTIGRLVPQKGIEFLLRAVEIMPNDNSPEFKVLIVGDGPLLQSLKSKVSSSKLKGKVIFTGFRKDIPEILKMIDILALPSLREGLPMILLEAMAAGCVVVATRVGGTPELVEDGVNGFLVYPKDPAVLADKLSYILKNQGRLDTVRSAARQTVEGKFNLKKMVWEHEGIYIQLASSRVASLAS